MRHWRITRAGPSGEEAEITYFGLEGLRMFLAKKEAGGEGEHECLIQMTQRLLRESSGR